MTNNAPQEVATISFGGHVVELGNPSFEFHSGPPILRGTVGGFLVREPSDKCEVVVRFTDYKNQIVPTIGQQCKLSLQDFSMSCMLLDSKMTLPPSSFAIFEMRFVQVVIMPSEPIAIEPYRPEPLHVRVETLDTQLGRVFPNGVHMSPILSTVRTHAMAPAKPKDPFAKPTRKISLDE